MTTNPLNQPCLHIAAPEEIARDPSYLFCNATPGAPCHWAKRFDGYLDPDFHSERLEAALPESQYETADQIQAFRQALLNTGLV